MTSRTGTTARGREDGLPSPIALLKIAIYFTVPLALWIANNYGALEEYFGARGLRDRNRAEVAQLEAEYRRLAEERAQLEVGGFAAEKAVRERHIMVKPGEKVIFLESESPVSAAAAHEPESDEDEAGEAEATLPDPGFLADEPEDPAAAPTVSLD